MSFFLSYTHTGYYVSKSAAISLRLLFPLIIANIIKQFTFPPIKYINILYIITLRASQVSKETV